MEDDMSIICESEGVGLAFFDKPRATKWVKAKPPTEKVTWAGKHNNLNSEEELIEKINELKKQVSALRDFFKSTEFSERALSTAKPIDLFNELVRDLSLLEKESAECVEARIMKNFFLRDITGNDLIERLKDTQAILAQDYSLESLQSNNSSERVKDLDYSDGNPEYKGLKMPLAMNLSKLSLRISRLEEVIGVDSTHLLNINNSISGEASLKSEESVIARLEYCKSHIISLCHELREAGFEGNSLLAQKLSNSNNFKENGVSKSNLTIEETLNKMECFLPKILTRLTGLKYLNAETCNIFQTLHNISSKQDCMEKHLNNLSSILDAEVANYKENFSVILSNTARIIKKIEEMNGGERYS